MLCAEELAPIELDAGPYETMTATSPTGKLVDSWTTISLPPKSGSQRSLSLCASSPPNHVAQGTLSPGRSVDDIQATSISLQTPEPPSNRMRSKSATYEPWHPTIKFVRAGNMQESQVSTPALSRFTILQQQGDDLSSIGHTRMSAWLSEQALGRPSSRTNNTCSPDPTSPGRPYQDTMKSVQHHQHDHHGGPPEPNSSDGETETWDFPSLSSPLPSSGKMQKDKLARQGDKMVERIIEVPVPAMEHVMTPHGVQLVDVSPKLPKSDILRRGAVRKKRFSWESEQDDLDPEAIEQPTDAEDSTPNDSNEHVHPQKHLPRRSCSISADASKDPVRIQPLEDVIDSKDGSLPSVAHAGRHQGHIILHLSPKTSPSPSPRFPLENGTLSPTRGSIAASKVVLVESAEERKASIATFEVGPHKPLPPLPLTPKHQPTVGITSKQPSSRASEQMSELIAMTNAAMPSARPQSALPHNSTAESIWRNLRTQASRATPKPGRMTTPFGAPSVKTPGPRVGHSRSISQLTGSKKGLEAPARQHSRSQSLVSPLGPPPTYSRPFNDVDHFPQGFADGTIVGSKPQVIPAPTDGHKSRKRLSIHLTPAGTFPYHPLRSSPVFAPTADAPATEEPQPVDYVKKHAPSPLQLKPSDRPSKFSSGEQPRLPAKMPFIGLPSSPRPRSKPSLDAPREQNATVSLDEVSSESGVYKGVAIDKIAFVTPRPSSAQSQLTSPTSSIFSNLRDSSVSATSSMADIDSAPFIGVVADTVAPDENQIRRVQQYHHLMAESKEKVREQMSMEADGVHTIQMALSIPPTPLALTKFSQTTSSTGSFVEKPPNVPKEIRPAGTRASLLGAPKTEEDLTNQPLIPTVIVRAPTVKLRPPERDVTPEARPPVLHVPELTAPQNDASDTTHHIETPTPQLIIDTAQCNDDVVQQNLPLAKPQGVMESLRKSWQFATNTPRLNLFADQKRTRSKSQSTLPEPHGKIAEAFAIARKHALLPWQWNDRENWPNRDSVSLDTGSIGNVEGSIRPFNSSFQARGPESEPVGQSLPKESRPESGSDSITSKILMRRVGPPVVVRMPC